MRETFKRCITCGSALWLGLASYDAKGQAALQPAVAPANTTASAPSLLPSSYSPPEIPRRMPSMPQADPQSGMFPPPASGAMPAYAAGMPTGGVMPAAAVAPRVDIHQGPSSRRVQSVDPAMPGVPQPLPGQPGSGMAMPMVPQQGGLTPQQGMAVQQILSGQSPVDMPQQPVIIVMPSGWDPNGGNVQFAPRAVSPEVPIEHWPISSRNPLGDGSSKGVFKWPKMAGARPENTADTPPGNTAEPDDTLVQRPIFGNTDNDRVAAASEKDKAEPQALFEWKTEDEGPKKALLASKSAAPPARQLAPPRRTTTQSGTKSLFSFWRKDNAASATEPAPPAAQTAQQSASRAPAAMPPAAPTPVAASAPAPVTAVTSQPAEPRVPQPAADGSKTQLASATQGNLKWRAKGSPRTRSTIDEPQQAADTSTNQVAVHNEPMPNEAMPQPPEFVATAPTQAVAAPVAVVVQPSVQPIAVEPVAMPAADTTAVGLSSNSQHKALLPLSLFGAKRPAAAQPKVQQQTAIVPNLLARAGLDDVPMRLPKRPPAHVYRTPADDMVARRMPTRPGAQAPGPETRHPTSEQVCEQTSEQPEDALVDEACDAPECDVARKPVKKITTAARSTDSYYAPAAEYVAEKSTRRQPEAQPTRQVAAKTEPAAACTQACQCPNCVANETPRQPPTMMIAESYSMRMARQQQQPSGPRRGRFETYDEVPTLAKPFWALSEVTKLPRFLVDDGEAQMQTAMQSVPAASVQCQCEKCQQMRALAAKAAAPTPQREPTLAAVKQPADEVVELAAEQPSQRRTNTKPSSRKATMVKTRQAEPEVTEEAVQVETETTEVVEEEPAVEPAAPKKRSRRATPSGPRQVVSNSVVTYDEPNDDGATASDTGGSSESEPEVKATSVRNRKGAKVLIYNKSDAPQNTSARVSGGRTNPLR